MVIFLVTFLESLALVGLLLPGTVMMASVGALIGSGQVDLYLAWAAGGIGCFLGDWISYFIGRAFKGPLHRWSFLKKHKAMLDRTDSDDAPWYVIPADRKWFARLAITELLIEALESLDLQWPEADFDIKEQKRRLAKA